MNPDKPDIGIQNSQSNCWRVPMALSDNKARCIFGSRDGKLRNKFVGFVSGYEITYRVDLKIITSLYSGETNSKQPKFLKFGIKDRHCISYSSKV